VGVLGVLAEDPVDLGGGGVGEGAGVDDDRHRFPSGLDGGQRPAVPVPDPQALVVAGRDDRDEDAVLADGRDELPEGVVGADLPEIVVGEQGGRVELDELGGRFALRRGGGVVGHGVPPWCA
jgi:hypothetical protein